MKFKPWMGWVIALVVVVVIAGWIFGTYNSLVTLQANADKTWANIETDYQRRFDLIPNLVETVKGITKQELTVFGEVTKLRSQWAGAKTTDEKIAAASQLESGLGRLIAVSENYPELKSATNFLALQDELAGTENRITVSRQRFNEAVTKYNIKTRTVPSNLIAGMFGFTEKQTFKSEFGAENPVGVKF